jgi:hypothetical protein
MKDSSIEIMSSSKPGILYAFAAGRTQITVLHVEEQNA